MVNLQYGSGVLAEAHMNLHALRFPYDAGNVHGVLGSLSGHYFLRSVLQLLNNALLHTRGHLYCDNSWLLENDDVQLDYGHKIDLFCSFHHGE